MKKAISIYLCLIMIFTLSSQAQSTERTDINALIDETSTYIYKTVSSPKVGSIGGEWAVLGLARSGADISLEYYENYYDEVERYVRECKGNLHDKKYTEYSRVIVALTAIGKNPADVSGYNLLTPLGDYEKTVWQGINGSIWALIALDCGGYEMPQNANAKIQATRQMYVDHILKKQTSDGGWALSGDVADPDITGMALQALSKYRSTKEVAQAIDRALDCMSQKQDANGGFSSWGESNSESSVQAIVALCELGISLYDARFVKNGNTILDDLIKYRIKGKGFKHTLDGGSNLMATEQALYALVAVERMEKGMCSLYDMSDCISIDEQNSFSGLNNKNPDVKKMEVVYKGKTFDDIAFHKNKGAIEALAQRNVINGKSQNAFEPDATMTRAEFAAIVTRGLGLPQKRCDVFDDVGEGDWFYNYVSTAYEYGIIKGVSDRSFNPNSTITREEAAVMIARAAYLCGMDTEKDTFESRNILAQFLDYVKVSDWAVGSVAFCYGEGILSDEVMQIKPNEKIKRAEIADMLYNMLLFAQLI